LHRRYLQTVNGRQSLRGHLSLGIDLLGGRGRAPGISALVRPIG